jgi:hypothetical protein
VHPPCGLYLRIKQGGGALHIEENVTTSPLCSEDRNLLLGIRVGMHGFEFDILIDGHGVNFPLQQAVFHPWQLSFSNHRRRHVLVVTWRDRTSSDIVVGYDTTPAE